MSRQTNKTMAFLVLGVSFFVVVVVVVVLLAVVTAGNIYGSCLHLAQQLM